MGLFEVTKTGSGKTLKVRFRLVGAGGQLYDAAVVASAAGVEVEGGWPVMTPAQTLKVAEWLIVAAAVANEIAVGAGRAVRRGVPAGGQPMTATATMTRRPQPTTAGRHGDVLLPTDIRAEMMQAAGYLVILRGLSLVGPKDPPPLATPGRTYALSG